MKLLGPSLVIVVLLATVAFTIYYLIKTRHIEQMAKIESGIIDKEIKNYGNILLNLAILFFSLAAGIFVSYMFSANTNIPDYVIIPGFLLLFGGIGFLISYFVNKKKSS
ncbi:DUF6249 domain-containing protein [Aureibaculum sp. 2210JD6-5]|uniref:DUF6249 domain-containing protein n=1 Tax=Aureibaculum sp. 2210JD6-5 TaxID=3103957 RepID=UPI002AAEC1DB|nr:DUF6249 domain-containing protein [Aureibaculum sp. 2210JD6-5]MDY7395620.1 DUF6249 domain-containing protein [Aureibaculum sp. 2210JD6-5]